MSEPEWQKRNRETQKMITEGHVSFAEQQLRAEVTRRIYANGESPTSVRDDL